MWMDLWEKERNQSQELFIALKKANQALLEKDSIIEYSNKMLNNCESINNEMLENYEKALKKNNILGIPNEISVPSLVVSAFILGILVK